MKGACRAAWQGGDVSSAKYSEMRGAVRTLTGSVTGTVSIGASLVVDMVMV